LYTPNTYKLSDDTFVDAYGLFCFASSETIKLVVPDFFIHGKLGKCRGKPVKLKLEGSMQYGDIVKIEKVSRARKYKTKTLSYSYFKNVSSMFYSIPNYTKQKRLEGIKLFDMLRSYDPVYFQKCKDWKRSFDVTSRVGDYFVVDVTSARGSLAQFNGKKCLVVATYNAGFKNGFLAIPITE
jgi:hypothetical protein